MGKKSESKRRSLPKTSDVLLTEKLKDSNDLSNTDVQSLIHELQVHQIELETQNKELRRAQLELEESRDKYAEWYDFASVGYFTLNENSIIVELSLAAAALLGVERNNLLKQLFSRYVAEENHDVFYSYRKRLLETKTTQTSNLKMLRKDHTHFFAQLEGIASFDDEGKFSHFRMAILDITEHKRTEEALRRQIEILDLANDTIMIRDFSHVITYWNQGAEWLYGWMKEEAVGKTAPDLLQTEFPKPLEEINEELLREGRWEGELVRTKRDGTRVKLSSRWTLQRDIERKPAAILEISRDITEQRQIEIAIKQQRDFYEALLKTQSDVGECFFVIEDDRIIFVNEACEKISGYSKSEMTTMPSFLDIIVPEQHDLIRDQLHKRLFGQELGGQFELGILNKNRELVNLEIAMHTVKVGERAQLIVIGRDISERKRAEDALYKSEERLRIALEGASLGNWDWNLENGNLEWSERCKAMFGLDPDTVMSYEVFLSALHPDDRFLTDQAVRDALENHKNYDIEYRTVWADGSIHWIHARGLVIYDVYGKPRRMLGIAMDITERKLNEETLSYLIGETQEARDHFAFLAKASALLSESLDYETTLKSLARLAVPTIADWCTVDIVMDDGSVKRIAVAHVDPARLETAYELQRRYPLDLNAPHGVPNVLRTGQPEFYPEITDSLLVSVAQDEEHLRVLRELNLGSAICMPITTHGKTIGVITLEWAESGQRYSVNDIAILTELSHRASTAIENAKLYQTATEEINERKKAEQWAKSSLQEKEMLLKEIHHRVKNNLQIISSLLSLQSRGIDSIEAREELRESQNRVKSMALIHEKLYQSGNFAGVEFRKYAKSLANHLFRSYGTKKIKLKINIDGVLLNIDKAVPCALILNELLTNSLKHAFPPGEDRTDVPRGEIRIALHLDNRRGDPAGLYYTLTIGNDGAPFPKDVNFRNTKSLGLRLVCALTKQLDGNIELDTSSGTEFRITFSP